MTPDQFRKYCDENSSLPAFLTGRSDHMADSFKYALFIEEGLMTSDIRKEHIKRTREQAAVMLAFADGATIEMRHRGSSVWNKCGESPKWNHGHWEYRIYETAAQVRFRRWAQEQGRIRQYSDKSRRWLTFKCWDRDDDAGGFFVVEDECGYRIRNGAYEGEADYRKGRIAGLKRAQEAGKAITLDGKIITIDDIIAPDAWYSTELLERMVIHIFPSPSENFNNSDQPSTITFMRKTHDLQWVKCGGKRILQQAWMDTGTGYTEWRDVPLAGKSSPGCTVGRSFE